ncbi:hypothetical protein DEU56DRAFT_903399 [Suillus clintonianus]|uniref:uncharacterized protein n=1 Tax=Suillus clintonianus TaxID=1904413 RepID=UPI001B873074|nr:uncharacterized protein DEU56DRAFT_903399 [Suillus clintonianus]KAG2126591.1 hypothetical protein DEU56DRAFT_903399 [Suillus clintonianus]
MESKRKSRNTCEVSSPVVPTFNVNDSMLNSGGFSTGNLFLGQARAGREKHPSVNQRQHDPQDDCHRSVSGLLGCRCPIERGGNSDKVVYIGIGHGLKWLVMDSQVVRGRWYQKPESEAQKWGKREGEEENETRTAIGMSGSSENEAVMAMREAAFIIKVVMAMCEATLHYNGEYRQMHWLTRTSFMCTAILRVKHAPSAAWEMFRAPIEFRNLEMVLSRLGTTVTLPNFLAEQVLLLSLQPNSLLAYEQLFWVGI